VDDAITQARELARGLQPVTLEAGGLAGALRQLAAKIEETFHIACICECDAGILVHDNAAAIHLYRIAQEAVSNAIKHGKARTIVLELSPHEQGLLLKIIDDGIGFSEQRVRGDGIGMQSMAYRARIIGGTLDIQAGHRGGTVVTCTIRDIPVVKEADDGDKETEASEAVGAQSGRAPGKRRASRAAKEKSARDRRSSNRSRAPGRAD
jgi:signal transduction histidine kinase